MLLQRRRNVQVGRGLGSVLTSVFRTLSPYAKTLLNFGRRIFTSKPGRAIVKTAQQSAVESGLKVVDDVIKGKNVKASLKENVKAVAKNVGSSTLTQVKKMVDSVEGSPSSRKRPKKKKTGDSSKRGKYPKYSKRSKGDIFDAT